MTENRKHKKEYDNQNPGELHSNKMSQSQGDKNKEQGKHELNNDDADKDKD
ncbi:hypothetical protein ACFSMW_14565 [Virgibacillus halophilus]|uniref:3-methyladenine DNA glycosylase n=1 Tax=Tigheibacillus halophilus TaxID=361280 RepID=A0ABU5C2Z9_9BACI|nr:hypothetical protein [Virgibacillus halophilus]